MPMSKPGDVVSYLQMCAEEGVNLQRGMNFRLRRDRSLILMSLRKGAPYADRVEDGGKVLIYEGHDVARTQEVPDPKKTDQPEFYPSGRRTQNGLFCEAVRRFKRSESPPERVKVFEKIHAGIWVSNGLFTLADAWQEESNGRKVFKFKLELVEDSLSSEVPDATAIEHDRVIPSVVKLEVWKRDKGKCVICGSKTNLHFDHDIPYSQGGSSKNAENIQILCAKHNLAKRDRII
jgi:hypothetical protein